MEKIFITIYYFFIALFGLFAKEDVPSSWAEASVEEYNTYPTPNLRGYKKRIRKEDFIRLPLFIYEAISKDRENSKLINSFSDIENIYVDKLVTIGVLSSENKLFYPDNDVTGDEMIDFTLKAIGIALEKYISVQTNLDKDDLVNVFKSINGGKLKLEKPVTTQEAVVFYLGTIELVNKMFKPESIQILTSVAFFRSENERIRRESGQ